VCVVISLSVILLKCTDKNSALHCLFLGRPFGLALSTSGEWSPLLVSHFDKGHFRSLRSFLNL